MEAAERGKERGKEKEVREGGREGGSIAGVAVSRGLRPSGKTSALSMGRRA